jgi:hypothetical protein
MRQFRATLLLAVSVETSSTAQAAQFVRVGGPRPATITASSTDEYVRWINAATSANATVQTATTLIGDRNWMDRVQVLLTHDVTTHRLFDFNLSHLARQAGAVGCVLREELPHLAGTLAKPSPPSEHS